MRVAGVLVLFMEAQLGEGGTMTDHVLMGPAATRRWMIAGLLLALGIWGCQSSDPNSDVVREPSDVETIALDSTAPAVETYDRVPTRLKRRHGCHDMVLRDSGPGQGPLRV
jgi:hypothetical protein